MSEMLTEKSIKETPVDPGDHDRMSHYIPKDKLADAMVFGTPLKALCGKKWVPTRDGLKFPVCPACKEAWEKLPSSPGA